MWRCNRDGSQSELLISGDYLLTGLAIDSSIGKLFYADAGQIRMADLDGSNSVYVTHVEPPATNRFAVEDGYVCSVGLTTPSYLGSSLVDGSDYQVINAQAIPGMIDEPEIDGVAIYVDSSSPVGSTTWGRLKSRFR